MIGRWLRLEDTLLVSEATVVGAEAGVVMIEAEEAAEAVEDTEAAEVDEEDRRVVPEDRVWICSWMILCRFWATEKDTKDIIQGVTKSN